MPRYRCMLSSPVDEPARERMVAGLARIESERFGTSGDDLLVEFTEVAEGRWFTGAEASTATVVTGTVPDGTTQDDRVALMDEVGWMVAHAFGQNFDDIMVVASDGRRGREEGTDTMPMYQCYTPEGALDGEKRATIASALTDIHCALTTAPPTFVHVLFHEHQPKWADGEFAIHGGIRTGRPQEVTDGLVSQMTQAMADTVGIDRAAISMKTSETPASWIMEGGAVMPEPGQEAAWMAGRS